MVRGAQESFKAYIERFEYVLEILMTWYEGLLIPDDIKVEYLLDNARLSESQIQLMKTAVNHEKTYTIYREAMLKQFKEAHIKEKGLKTERSTSSRWKNKSTLKTRTSIKTSQKSRF